MTKKEAKEQLKNAKLIVQNMVELNSTLDFTPEKEPVRRVRKLESSSNCIVGILEVLLY